MYLQAQDIFFRLRAVNIHATNTRLPHRKPVCRYPRASDARLLRTVTGKVGQHRTAAAIQQESFRD